MGPSVLAALIIAPKGGDHMANTLHVRGDRRAAFSPSVLAMQSDNLTPLTVTFNADALDLYGTNPTFYIDWLLPDATDLYTGPYTPAASVAVTIPDTVLAQEGTLRAQVRVSDDEGQVWRSMEAHTVLRRALTADEPAGAGDGATFTAPTLLNSWANTTPVGGVASSTGYNKDGTDVVRFRGVISGGVAGTVAFQLPAAYRPLQHYYFIASCSGSSVGKISVAPSGDVTIDALTSWISLASVSYVAAT